MNGNDDQPCERKNCLRRKDLRDCIGLCFVVILFIFLIELAAVGWYFYNNYRDAWNATVKHYESEVLQHKGKLFQEFNHLLKNRWGN